MYANLIALLIQYPILIISITVHEYFHGLVAEIKGDNTARIMGRLTLNPIAHIDPIGTLLLPVMSIITHLPLFGWAKPVPVNPYRLNNPKKDMMFIGFAGPLSNFTLAMIAALLLYLIKQIPAPFFVRAVFEYFVILNVILAVFNLIPVPPLDGSKILAGLLPDHLAYKYESMNMYGFIIIILLLSTGVLSGVLWPIVVFIVRWLGVGIYG